MSYCVNCGVELSEGTKACPLCNTPVVNPNEIKRLQYENSFPRYKGQVERVRRKDIGLLISVLLVSVVITCGLLNIYVFSGISWSLAVIGACILLWVLLIPLLIYRNGSAYQYVAFDALAIGLYLVLIAKMSGMYEWLWKLGLPIVGLMWLLVEIGIVCYLKLSKSIIAVALYLFSGLGLLCVGLDLLIDCYRKIPIAVSWSAVVLTVCIVFDVVLATMLSQTRVRNAVRRRLHF